MRLSATVKAAAEELEKRREEVKQQVAEAPLTGDKGGGAGGIMGSMFAGGGAFMSGGPSVCYTTLGLQT